MPNSGACWQDGTAWGELACQQTHSSLLAACCTWPTLSAHLRAKLAFPLRRRRPHRLQLTLQAQQFRQAGGIHAGSARRRRARTLCLHVPLVGVEVPVSYQLKQNLQNQQIIASAAAYLRQRLRQRRLQLLLPGCRLSGGGLPVDSHLA